MLEITRFFLGSSCSFMANNSTDWHLLWISVSTSIRRTTQQFLQLSWFPTRRTHTQTMASQALCVSCHLSQKLSTRGILSPKGPPAQIYAIVKHERVLSTSSPPFSLIRATSILLLRASESISSLVDHPFLVVTSVRSSALLPSNTVPHLL